MLISGSFCISRILGAKSQKEYGMQESVQFVTVCAYWIKTLYTCRSYKSYNPNIKYHISVNFLIKIKGKQKIKRKQIKEKREREK